MPPPPPLRGSFNNDLLGKNHCQANSSPAGDHDWILILQRD